MAPFPFPATPTAEPEIDRWQLRDPASLLTELDHLVPLTQGTLVALVHLPSTRQELMAAVPVDWADTAEGGDMLDAELDGDARSELLRRAAEKLWGRRPTSRRRPEHAFVTVVARTGRAVFGPRETEIGSAWRYANHLLPVFDSELLLVTPHGWRAFTDDSCGAGPALT